MNISVVICTKNEEKRIKDCIDLIIQNKPDEIIVVDGNSQDRTVEILETYKSIHLIKSIDSNLTKDRQIGIDIAKNEFIAMIDADHRLSSKDLKSLYKDLKDLDLDIVQSGLKSFKGSGFWGNAEEQAWKLNHNIPGPKKMIGVAPAIFKKKVFDKVKFDSEITKTIDDTDFIYRLSKNTNFRIGIGTTEVSQFHFPSVKNYIKKFIWYGVGDGEFSYKHPNRAFSIIFHITIRYIFLYPLKALLKGYLKVIPFFILQGWFRILGLLKFYFSLK